MRNSRGTISVIRQENLPNAILILKVIIPYIRINRKKKQYLSNGNVFVCYENSSVYLTLKSAKMFYRLLIIQPHPCREPCINF
jgi:hypothetical protein